IEIEVAALPEWEAQNLDAVAVEVIEGTGLAHVGDRRRLAVQAEEVAGLIVVLVEALLGRSLHVQSVGQDGRTLGNIVEDAVDLVFRGLRAPLIDTTDHRAIERKPVTGGVIVLRVRRDEGVVKLGIGRTAGILEPEGISQSEFGW